MPRSAIIQNQSRSTFPAVKMDYASTFLEKLRGLMFRYSLQEDEGLLLVESRDSRINSAIHMFFMNFDIGVVWVDSTLRVVGKTLAKRWHPLYAPKQPARFTLELHPDRLANFSVGDHISITIEN